MARAKALNLRLRIKATGRDFGEAVSNLHQNAKGELVITRPMTWRQ